MSSSHLPALRPCGGARTCSSSERVCAWGCRLPRTHGIYAAVGVRGQLLYSGTASACNASKRGKRLWHSALQSNRPENGPSEMPELSQHVASHLRVIEARICDLWDVIFVGER